MSKRIDETLSQPGYDGLIIGNEPAADVFTVTIRKLSAAAATLKRGTVLAKSSVDNKLVILGTAAVAAVQAADAVYTITSDVAVNAAKTYYTRSGNAGSYVYTAVASPAVANIATYYEMTTPAVAAQDAETLTPDCILCDDIDVGTTADVSALAYRTGKFNTSKLIVKTSYTMTDTDKEALRSAGILLDTAINA